MQRLNHEELATAITIRLTSEMIKYIDSISNNRSEVIRDLILIHMSPPIIAEDNLKDSQRNTL